MTEAEINDARAEWIAGMLEAKREADRWEQERADAWRDAEPPPPRRDHFGPRIGSGFEPDYE